MHVPTVRRERFERWPRVPTLRNETGWEEEHLCLGSSPSSDQGTLILSRPACIHLPIGRSAVPRLVLGDLKGFSLRKRDWPPYSNDAEFRFFDCDGLVCTNPDYFERNRHRYKCDLIPNGVDLSRFRPGKSEKARFGLPEGPVVLMASALIESKNVAEGIAAMTNVSSATLVVAGDGPLRDEMRKLGDQLIPDRYIQLTVPAADMPALYRSADAFMHLSVDEFLGMCSSKLWPVAFLLQHTTPNAPAGS